VWIHPGTRVNELWHTCEREAAHLSMSHGARINEVLYVHEVWCTNDVCHARICIYIYIYIHTCIYIYIHMSKTTRTQYK